MLKEEALAGWILVEKFDDYRIRLKRKKTDNKNDSNLDFDPYRSDYGTSIAKVNSIMFLISTVIITLIVVILAFFLA